MSYLNKFVKRNFLWILLALLLAGSHLLYLYLLPASVEDIGYAALLDTCLLGLFFFLAWIGYIRRVKKFQKLLALPIPDQIKVPEPVDDIEQLYGQILENVAIQQRLLEDQTQLQQTEMYDYYARWVHQIKTPIAALQLLLETQKKDVAKNAETILEKTGKENAVLENLLEQLAERGFEGIAAEMPHTAVETEAGELSAETETARHSENVGLTSESVGLTVAIPIDCTAVGNLKKLLEAKGNLIKKALGIDSLPIEVKEEAVEFPWFETVSPEETAAYTHFISALCELSKNAKRVTAKEKEVDNEKYAFRCFLLRLGFIGTEYKAERKILLRNLSGSAAFKTVKDGEQE